MKLEKYRSVGLRNLENELTLIECGEIERLIDDDCDYDDYDNPTEIIKYMKYEIYVEPDNNNIILALFNTYERKYLPDDILGSVSSMIEKKYYNYLIDTLNENTDMFVQWTQIEGTFSDYKIFYDFLKDDCYYKRFSDLEPLLCFCGDYKYTEVRNGTIEAIQRF